MKQGIVQGVPRLVWQVGHPFFRTYVDAAGCPFTWWSGIVADLIFWKKHFEIFFWFRVWARYKSSMVFRLSTVWSKFKFMLPMGIQLFGLKTTSHGKPDLKNEFSWQFCIRFTVSVPAPSALVAVQPKKGKWAGAIAWKPYASSLSLKKWQHFQSEKRRG